MRPLQRGCAPGQVEGGVRKRVIDPTWPSFKRGIVEAMEELELEAAVLGGEGADAKTAKELGATHKIPGDEALGSGEFVLGHSEEGVSQVLEDKGLLYWCRGVGPSSLIEHDNSMKKFSASN
jgi:hypothetical protein